MMGKNITKGQIKYVMAKKFYVMRITWKVSCFYEKMHDFCNVPLYYPVWLFWYGHTAAEYIALKCTGCADILRVISTLGTINM